MLRSMRCLALAASLLLAALSGSAKAEDEGGTGRVEITRWRLDVSESRKRATARVEVFNGTGGDIYYPHIRVHMLNADEKTVGKSSWERLSKRLPAGKKAQLKFAFKQIDEFFIMWVQVRYLLDIPGGAVAGGKISMEDIGRVLAAGVGETSTDVGDELFAALTPDETPQRFRPEDEEALLERARRIHGGEKDPETRKDSPPAGGPTSDDDRSKDDADAPRNRPGRSDPARVVAEIMGEDDDDGPTAERPAPDVRNDPERRTKDDTKTKTPRSETPPAPAAGGLRLVDIETLPAPDGKTNVVVKMENDDRPIMANALKLTLIFTDAEQAEVGRIEYAVPFAVLEGPFTVTIRNREVGDYRNVDLSYAY